MAVHKPPEDILKLFEGGKAPEGQKARARALVITWLQDHASTIRPGDTVLIPHPDTGELELWCKKKPTQQ